MWWRLIPGPIRRGVLWLLGAVAFALFMRNIGRRDEKHKATAKRAVENVKAAETAKDTRHEIETSDDQHLVNILTGKLHDRKR